MLPRNIAAYVYGVDDHEYYPIAEMTDVTATLTSEIDCASSCTLTGELIPVKPVKEFDDFIKKSDDFNRGYEVGKAIGNFYDYILGSNPITSGIEKVIFNPPATIVIWKDGSKTVVKCMEGDSFSEWTGLSLCICKKILGEDFHGFFRKYCNDGRGK